MKLLYLLLFATCIASLVIQKYQGTKRKYNDALNALKQKHKEDLYEDKLRFFTNITHEFRTPLTLIDAPCERILAHEGIDEYVRKYVKLIQRHTARLYGLTQEVIDYRRIETKHWQLHLERCNMSDYILNTYEIFIDWVEKKEINYIQEVEPGIYWNMDMRCIPNVVANLISNAIKYTPQKGTLKVKLSKLSEEQIEIRVYNTGKGIKEEDKQYVFYRYATVLDGPQESSADGIVQNGLGLAICHSTVKLLGGDIVINSEEGKYAEFVVTLPLLPITEDVAKDAAPLTQQSIETIKKQLSHQVENEFLKEEASERFSRWPKDGRPTILVIDDNQDVQFLLNEILSISYNVKIANSVDEALEQVRIFTPQLIITDVMMSGKDGIELTQQIRQDKYTMHIPLIILSAKATEEDKIKGIQMGADAYIGKPFDIQYLLAVIERLIDSREKIQLYYNSSACAYDYVEGQLLKREDKAFLYKLDEFVEAHLNDSDLSTEAIAAAMNMSVRSLYRRLNEMNLPSPKDYLKERKMEKVVKLLKTTNLSVQEIIYDCGFNNRAHFYKDFSQRFGMTPKEFRNTHKNGQDTLEEK